MTTGTSPEAPASFFPSAEHTPDGQQDSKRGRSNAVFFILAASMTAGVMEDERERCASAGMADFVPKPVVAATLCKAVERWVSPAATKESPA